MNSATESILGRFRSGTFRSAGFASANACRTIRRCTPNFVATLFMDEPAANSNSRLICSNNSTFRLLSKRPPCRPHSCRSTVAGCASRGGPNQSIKVGQLRVSKSLDHQSFYLAEKASPEVGHRFLIAAHETFVLL